GKLVVYDPPEGDLRGAWRTFLTAMLSLAEVQSYCRMSDDRLAVIPVMRKGDELGLFILNPTRKAISADIIFPCNVEVSDLAATLSASPSAAAAGAAPAANRFSLDVPPCGILPIGVRGLGGQLQSQNQSQNQNQSQFSSQAQGPSSERPAWS